MLADTVRPISDLPRGSAHTLRSARFFLAQTTQVDWGPSRRKSIDPSGSMDFKRPSCFLTKKHHLGDRFGGGFPIKISGTWGSICQKPEVGCFFVFNL